MSSLRRLQRLSVGSILLLIALGLAFSFGLMNVINMAHGELIMVGAYVAYRHAEAIVGSPGQPGSGRPIFLVAFPVAFCVAALIGAALERC